MPPKILPGGKVIFLPQHAGDFVIDLTQYPEIDAAISHEDTAVIGTWSDFSGSGGALAPGQVMKQGLANKLEGDLFAKAAGARLGDLNIRGNRIATTRARPKLITVEITNE